jgi:O-succinylbenzoic acid--CoA ligase
MSFGVNFNLVKAQTQIFWEGSSASTDKNALNYAQGVFEILDAGGSVNMSQDAPLPVGSKTKRNTFIFNTSGTTGTPKQIFHSLSGLEKANCRLQEFLGLWEPYNAISCLPVFHVGGWMQVMRSWFSGGGVCFTNYRDFKLPELSSLFSQRFVSLVPAQLHELLQSTVACQNLRLCKGVFLGGAACDNLMLARAREEELPLLTCYGMTETAGMVTVLSKEDFMNGVDGVGQVMPQVSLQLDAIGRICIRCKSLPEPNGEGETSSLLDWLTTADIGHCNSEGYWQISHRIDRIINSGGKKVVPGIIENKILTFPEIKACRVSFLRDRRWGQKVVAYVSPSNVNTSELDRFLREELQPFEVPKEYFATEQLPTNLLGK